MLPLARLTAALSLLLAAPLANAQDAARSAPATHCLDVRQLAGLQQPADDRLVATAGGRHLAVQLDGACPGIAREDGLQILAPGGWLCGGDNERLRTPSRECAISGARPISASAYAQAARQAARETASELPGVEVTAKAGIDRRKRYAHGFAGTPDYCLNPSQMRAWSETPNGLELEVAPQFNGGNRYYRVELAGHCPGLAGTPELVLRSGMGLGVICGNAGDAAVLRREGANGGGTREVARCAIGAVYPISR